MITCLAEPECYGKSWVSKTGDPAETDKCAPGRSRGLNGGDHNSKHFWDWDMEHRGPPVGCQKKANPTANSLKICNQCLSNLPKADALIVGASIHLLGSRGNDGAKVVDDINWLRDQHENMIWTSGPHAEIEKVTSAQRKYFRPPLDALGRTALPTEATGRASSTG